MKINKILFFGLLAAVVAMGTVGEVFSGSITITNELPSYVVDGKEKNVVSVKFRINWLHDMNVGARITDFYLLGLPNSIVQLATGKTLYERANEQYPAHYVDVEMNIYPGATETWGKLGVWITDFSFSPSDIVVRGERGASDDYTGPQKWNKIYVEGHQAWKLWLKRPFSN